MPKFELTFNGARYEVEAPDEQSALSAFQSEVVGAEPTNQDRYQSSLQDVRRSQFPNMSDEQWAAYSAQAFPPANFNEVARGSQVFGFGDEINAGIGAFGSQVRNWMGDQSSPGFGEAYGQYSELEQARRDLGREQLGEPAAFTAEVLGGLATVGPGGSVGAATVAPTRLQTVTSGLTTGGLMGGLYGFGSADEDRVASALIGGGTGAAVGAAAPYLVDAGAGLYGAARNSMATRAASADLGVSPQSANILRTLTGMDQSLGPQGQAGIQAAGREAMLLDAGDNSRMAADYLMRKPGQAGAIVGDALGERAARDSGALTDALNIYLGDPQGVATLRRNIATGTEAERSAAYRAAYEAPIDYSSEAGRRLEETIRNRVSQADINAANELMRAEGAPPSQQIMAQIADDGTVTYQRMPNIQQIDYITRALNDRAAANAGLGALGGQTNQGRVYSGLSSDLRGAARDAVPEYATALETAADPIRRSQATQFGYDLLSPAVPRDVAATQAAAMTGPEREAAALGIRSRLDDTLANVRQVVSTGQEQEVRQAVRAMQDLTSPASRTKIASVIGDQDAALLFDEVDRVFVSLQREALRRTGSQTAGRQFMDETFGPYTNPNDLMTNATRGKPLDAGRRAIQLLTGMTDENMAARADQIGSEVARALISQGPDLQRNIAALQRFNAARTNNDRVAQALAARLLPVGTPLSYQTSMQTAGNRR